MLMKYYNMPIIFMYMCTVLVNKYLPSSQGALVYIRQLNACILYHALTVEYHLSY